MTKEKISIYSLKYAESFLPENTLFCGGDKNKKIPITFVSYLIQTDDRNIIVDPGCDTMPGWDMKHYYSPAFVLRQAGVSTKDITDVVITHAHHDHIECVKYYTNAVVYISDEEFPKGKRYLPDGAKVNTFADEFVIHPQIKIVKIGGHSLGSSVVEIETDDITHVIAGDECYSNQNIEKKIFTASFYNKEKAIKFIEKYCNEKYRVHICHDISLKTERII